MEGKKNYSEKQLKYWNSMKNKVQSDESNKKRSESLKLSYKNGTKKSWNKGLTKNTDQRILNQSEKVSKTMKKLASEGKLFTKEHTDNISKALKGRKITWYTGHPGIESHRKNVSMLEEYGEEKSKKLKNNLSNIMKNKLKNPIFKKEWHDKMTKKALESLRFGKRTKIELIVENMLKELNINYIPQKIIKVKTQNGGNWRSVDFYLPESNLVIECDGEYWHTVEGNKIKNEELNGKGFDVIRYWGNQILNNTNYVKNHIEIWHDKMMRFRNENKKAIA